MRRPLWSVAALAALYFAWPQASGAVEEPHTTPAPLLDLQHLQVTGGVATAPFGRDLTALLTLDVDLQHTADRLLQQARPLWGGVVMIEAHSGKVLVWSQYRRDGQAQPAELATRLFPSASVFKIVTTAALLEDSPVTLNSRVCVVGGEHGIEQQHLLAPTDPHRRCLRFFRALGFSVNAAYAQLVTQHLAPADLLSVADGFGFNRELPFDAPARVGKLELPEGDLNYARTATGFEHTQLTVLGAAHLAHTIALEGRTPRVHLVQSVGDYTAPDQVEVVGRTIRVVTARRLARMMEVTVHSGTALESFTDETTGMSYLADLRAAGKTGTLQVPGQKATASWFTGFAPARAPRVVVAVMLENSPVWRRKGADVARDLLRAYLSDHRGVSHPFEH